MKKEVASPSKGRALMGSYKVASQKSKRSDVELAKAVKAKKPRQEVSAKTHASQTAYADKGEKAIKVVKNRYK